MLEEIVNPIFIVTLGESTVGKTAYIRKYVDGNYGITLATIGFDIYKKYCIRQIILSLNQGYKDMELGVGLFLYNDISLYQMEKELK